MSELICPFCQQEYIIHKDDSCFGQQRCVCRNPNCVFDGWHFPVKLVSELIRTRKALDVAVDALKDIRCVYTGDQTTKPSTMFGRAASALNKIQDLEQKDE